MIGSVKPQPVSNRTNQKDLIVVLLSVFIVGFFFIFGPTAISLIKKLKPAQAIVSGPQVLIQDESIGKGDEVALGSRVTINYTGRLVNRKVFDSSLSRNEPFQFVLGSGQVISGLDKGIVGIRVGGKRIITIPPELGYGKANYGSIPANSTLIFEVELLKAEK